MEIILLKDVDKVGDKHDVVKVKDGYGRNYLLPNGLAIVANAVNKRKLADFVRKEEAIANKHIDDFKEMAQKLKGITLKIGAKAGTSGKIFGSVTNVQLANAIKEQTGLEIERKKIHLPDEVKELGSYVAKIDLHKQVPVSIDFEVIAE